MEAYQLAWANLNKSKPKTFNFGSIALSLFIWAVCGLTFAQVAVPEYLPDWLVNVTKGSRWVLALLFLLVDVLVLLIVLMQGGFLFSLKELADKKEVKAREIYEKNKVFLADNLSYRFDSWQKFYLVQRIAQILLLFGGGSIFLGVFLALSLVWVHLVWGINRNLVKDWSEPVLKPETVAWLENKNTEGYKVISPVTEVKNV